MFALTKTKAKTSSRRQIDIKEVKDGVLSLSNNRYRLVGEISPLNFELKSEAEQDMIIENYFSFINSLNFDLQILVRIRRLDIDSYLESMKSSLSSEKQKVYRLEQKNYFSFVRSLVNSSNILGRRFFVVIGVSNPDYLLAEQQLNLNFDITVKNLAKLGMSCRLLSSMEVLSLFYDFYCDPKLQPLEEATLKLIDRSIV